MAEKVDKKNTFHRLPCQIMKRNGSRQTLTSVSYSYLWEQKNRPSVILPLLFINL